MDYYVQVSERIEETWQTAIRDRRALWNQANGVSAPPVPNPPHGQHRIRSDIFSKYLSYPAPFSGINWYIITDYFAKVFIETVGSHMLSTHKSG